VYAVSSSPSTEKKNTRKSEKQVPSNIGTCTEGRSTAHTSTDIAVNQAETVALYLNSRNQCMGYSNQKKIKG
jgi:hypothetical protein